MKNGEFAGYLRLNVRSWHQAAITPLSDEIVAFDLAPLLRLGTDEKQLAAASNSSTAYFARVSPRKKRRSDSLPQ
jgi:hypothetical protein